MQNSCPRKTRNGVSRHFAIGESSQSLENSLWSKQPLIDVGSIYFVLFVFFVDKLLISQNPSSRL